MNNEEESKAPDSGNSGTENGSNGKQPPTSNALKALIEEAASSTQGASEVILSRDEPKNRKNTSKIEKGLIRLAEKIDDELTYAGKWIDYNIIGNPNVQKPTKTEDTTKGAKDKPKQKFDWAGIGKSLKKELETNPHLNNFIYGSGDKNKATKEEKVAKYLASDYPNILSAVFGEDSGLNLGQRAARLGELILTVTGGAINGAAAGFRGQSAPAPTPGRYAQYYNAIGQANWERKIATDNEVNKNVTIPNEKRKAHIKNYLAGKIISEDKDIEQRLGNLLTSKSVPTFEEFKNAYGGNLPPYWYKDKYVAFIKAYEDWDAGYNNAEKDIRVKESKVALANSKLSVINYVNDAIIKINEKIKELGTLKIENQKSFETSALDYMKKAREAIQGIESVTDNYGLQGSLNIGFHNMGASAGASKGKTSTKDEYLSKYFDRMEDGALKFKDGFAKQYDIWNKFIDETIDAYKEMINDLKKNYDIKEVSQLSDKTKAMLAGDYTNGNGFRTLTMG